jgi:hypothetical protein
MPTRKAARATRGGDDRPAGDALAPQDRLAQGQGDREGGHATHPVVRAPRRVGERVELAEQAVFRRLFRF